MVQKRRYKREICVSDSCVAEDWSQFYLVDWQIVTCLNLFKPGETISIVSRLTVCNIGN